MNKIFLAVVTVSFMALGCNLAQPISPVNPAQQTSASKNDNSGAIVRMNEQGATNNSYSYKGVILTFELSSSDNDQVLLFGTKNGKKQKIADQIIKDCCGGSWPHFEKTKDPNIALLKTGTGDSGFYQQENYFIRISDLKVLKLINNSNPLITVSDFNNHSSDIFLSIQPECNLESSTIGKKVSIKGLSVNNSISLPILNRSLTCFDPGGIGSLYDPYFTLTPLGVNGDLTKVYFSLGFYSQKGDQPLIGTTESYVFNVDTKIITKEEPQNLLYSMPNQ